MKYLNLMDIGIGIGTFKLIDQNCYNLVLDAIRIGYRLIDTATLYGNHKEVGKAIKDSGINRSNLCICSKIHKSFIKSGKIQEGFESILSELDIDYIDILLLHEPYRSKDIKKYNEVNANNWRKMEEIYSTGRSKKIGISNYNILDVQNILMMCKIKPYINQIELSPFCQRKELTTYLRTNDIKIEAYRSLINGQKNDDNKLKTLSEKYEISIPKLLLLWARSNDYIIIPKPDDIEQLKENFSVKYLDISKLDQSDFDQLDQGLFTIKHHGDIYLK